MGERIDSYTDLVQAVRDAAEDSGNEFEEYLPVAIDNAELRLTRELDTYGLKFVTSVVASASNPFLVKPNGYRLGFHLSYVDPNTNRKTVLRKKTDDYLDDYWPQVTSVGTPKYYSDIDNSTFRIAPATSVNAECELHNSRRPDILTSANQTNYFTDFCSDALFYATMMEVASWQRNPELFNYYQQYYVAARDAINNEGRRQRRDDGTPVNNPEAGQNTLGTSRNQ